MQRLKIAQRELKSWISDCLALRAAQPNEVTACARVREALALIAEAEMFMARSQELPPSFAERLERLDQVSGGESESAPRASRLRA